MKTNTVLSHTCYTTKQVYIEYNHSRQSYEYCLCLFRFKKAIYWQQTYVQGVKAFQMQKKFLIFHTRLYFLDYGLV